MKYIEQEKSNTRIRRSYLFFPMTINGITRYAEFAEWEERHEADGGGGSGADWWNPLRWTDIDEKKTLKELKKKQK